MQIVCVRVFVCFQEVKIEGTIKHTKIQIAGQVTYSLQHGPYNI